MNKRPLQFSLVKEHSGTQKSLIALYNADWWLIMLRGFERRIMIHSPLPSLGGMFARSSAVGVRKTH